ncbi:glycine--tRNA ligase subunit beta [Lactobacillus pentosus]|jgi:glycyl-tRNA synthetase beta chain|uniref:glycine--tRNA ligase subunit beta n=1 Tax=Lactiplantibacillus pentosus TaxID=1589 RepID=UPI000EA9CB4C|nr:glycine--tRNA ligase subunit beta [Lactiplantibacillus pentosus]MCH4130476.1 glycine--tRNA ligase subunit beta [Lactiplantibacillus sp.]BBM23284.1 glycyl-tRNA synthetase beta subunit [Lactiplantibacillus plantarum]AYG37550.1 glycine--tRNA ligase subunit beta [Lactiplantibacillus pentosus]AYG40207.1 glycine--tRNA ligase subunit beta [Lactiplantibacillus pentosus]MCJ8182574.1 glycine--tRNA ligase subunit beta [Lactiplantibacillus pentosus]
MAKTYLLEIGLEEMPAHVVTPSVLQLKERMTKFLTDARLDFEDIKTFSTPRRLTVQVLGLADKQADVKKEVRGPAKKIAQDADGNWTKAAIGFSKGQGASTDDIVFKDVKGTPYVFVQTFKAGKTAAEVLTAGIKDVITKMNFPTMMKWSTFSFKYIRPIRWIVSLLDDVIVPVEILDVTADRVSRGHRFLGHDVEIATALDYEDDLASVQVIADADKRKAKIREQIADLAQAHDWQIKVNEDLLEEVNNLVEFPTAFAGDFDTKYLTIPDEVLITSMRDHQRFFYVTDADDNLLPHFVSVRNGNTDHLENVALGNQKVLTARLEDAAFFYHEDQQHSIQEYVERLKKVSFHDKIGTMYEKMQRVMVISAFLADRFGLTETEKNQLHRAAQIYKFDLVTGMVGEFPELQGVMGDKYAVLKGEDPVVGQAIREHYMPISADGDLPKSKVGAVLAIADKVDSISSFFAVGLTPSGSNDPFALRRQAFGIVRIVRDQGWDFPIRQIETAIQKELTANDATYNLDFAKQTAPVADFLTDRVKQWFSNHKLRYDIVDTVIKGSRQDIREMFKAADVLNAHQDDPQFKDTIEAFTRLLRITAKAKLDAGDLTVDPSLFENDAEQKLYDAVEDLKQKVTSTMSMEDRFTALASLRPLIVDYFEQTMVMSKDEQVRDNHLKQLLTIAQMVNVMGDLNQLVVK